MKRQAFTVIELMVVISIIALLAAMAASALSNAAEMAREQRTRAIVQKLDQLIMERWDSYRTRSVPYKPAAADTPRTRALARLNAIRELQRMEMPDNINDVWDDPVILAAIPSAARGYRRRAQPVGTWTGQYENAECLYLIVSNMKDGEKNAIEFFTSSEIGDVDDDGMPEILDGWGEPIHFLRWAPGYRSDATPSALTHQSRDPGKPDPFDPIRADPRVDPSLDTDPSNDTFALTPLIFSSGPDREAGVTASGGTFHYSATTPKNDPFTTSPNEFGLIYAETQAADNITNHSSEP